MKKKFLTGILATMICLTGCNSESSDLSSLNNENEVAIENVKNELSELNAIYKRDATAKTRMPKWLRFLIFGSADAAGAIFGGVSGACAASTLAWTVTKDEVSVDTTESKSESAIKSDNLNDIEYGSIGYVHNSVIANTLIENEDIYQKSNEDVLTLVLAELENQTGAKISDSQRADIVSQTTLIINSFDVNKTIDEYYDELIEQTTDTKQKEALEICAIVLDGLQYVDDSDTTYIESVKTIVNNSNLDSELKETLLDGIEVANASAKLWNTEEIPLVELELE
jgi:hypothetical protein